MRVAAVLRLPTRESKANYCEVSVFEPSSNTPSQSSALHPQVRERNAETRKPHVLDCPIVAVYQVLNGAP